MSELIIGLTGGIGSGKTAVSDLFQLKGIDVIDADVIAREVVKPGSTALDAIKTKFTNDILLADGSLDRRKMREVVFTNDDNKLWLNVLLHPLIRTEMLKQTRDAASCYCILSVPLLVENNMRNMVDRLLVVDVPTELQLERASQRDQQSVEQVANIIEAQATREQRIAIADDIIDNSGSRLELQGQIDSLHKSYEKMAINLSEGLKSH